VQLGFKVVRGPGGRFKGNIVLDGDIPCPITIDNIDPTFLALPRVVVENRSMLGDGPQAHISPDGSLCYLDRQSVHLDPMKPGNCMRIALGCARDTLNALLSQSQANQLDVAIEFPAYWGGDQIVSLLYPREGACLLYQAHNKDEALGEYAIVADDQAAQDWGARRRCTMKPAGRAIVIRLKTDFSFPSPDLDISWPPTTMKDFLSWVYALSPAVSASVLRQLVKVLLEDPSVCIALCDDRGSAVGVSLVMNGDRKSQLTRFKHSKKGALESNAIKRLRTVLTSSRFMAEFSRVRVIDARPRTIYGRNRPGQSLAKSRIALIGCGTIGSHAAEQLIKAGAGTGGRGELALFDGDVLYPANLGRHVLGVESLYRTKAEAMADHLKSRASAPLTVRSAPHLRIEDIATLRRYDLVIDATGDPVFSTWLSHKTRSSLWGKVKNKKPYLLHAWIEGGGDAVRLLMDDGSAACYHCLRVDTDDPNAQQERFPVYRNGMAPSDTPYIYRCGESFVPYSSGASAIAGGLVLNMALMALDPNADRRAFWHVPLTSASVNAFWKNATRKKGCACCELPY